MSPRCGTFFLAPLLSALCAGCSSYSAAADAGGADAQDLDTGVQHDSGGDGAPFDAGSSHDASRDGAANEAAAGPWCAPDAAVGQDNLCFQDAGTWCCLPNGTETPQCPAGANSGNPCDPGVTDGGTCFFCYGGTGFSCACDATGDAGAWQCSGGGYCTP